MTGRTRDLDEGSNAMKLKALFAFLVGGVLAIVTLSWTGVIPMASAQEDAEHSLERVLLPELIDLVELLHEALQVLFSACWS